jgi:hypothetical protein
VLIKSVLIKAGLKPRPFKTRSKSAGYRSGEPLRAIQKCNIDLETGDYYVWRGWKQEFYPTLLIGLRGGRRIERGERNVLGPVAVLPVVAADVDHAVGDGVAGDFLTMAIAIDQHGGREFRGWRFGSLLLRGRR